MAVRVLLDHGVPGELISTLPHAAWVWTAFVCILACVTFAIVHAVHNARALRRVSRAVCRAYDSPTDIHDYPW